jgi:hypothetical protein
VDQSVTLAATGGGSGRPVVYSVDPASGPGVCGLSGATLRYSASGRCVVDANQAGDARYQRAPQVQQVIVVSGIPQTIVITSEPPAVASQGVTYALKARGGGSAKPVTFRVDGLSSTSACTIKGAVVTFGKAGLCVIDANQAGDARYQPAAQVQQTIVVTYSEGTG